MEEAQQRLLISFVRQTIQNQLAGKPLPPVPCSEINIKEFGGMFVTLKNRGMLRGCMGQFHPTRSLFETAQKVALNSLNDPRFRDRPITENELDEITIEISVLSPMKRTNDPLSLEIGVHGIYIRKGFHSGCFLPQVATEQKWDKEQFLSHCCFGKAGLPPDAWKDPNTEVYLFSADIIKE